MLERRRRQKQYGAVPGEDDEDVELGEGHENGIAPAIEPSVTLEEEVDNWDENAVDNWDDDGVDGGDGDIAGGSNGKGKDLETGDIGEIKKRVD